MHHAILSILQISIHSHGLFSPCPALHESGIQAHVTRTVRKPIRQVVLSYWSCRPDGLNALYPDSLSRDMDALPHRVTVRLVIMKTWIVIDNYRTHGLAFCVAQCQRSYRRRLGVNALTARRMALVTVRTVLSHAIDNGGL